MWRRTKVVICLLSLRHCTIGVIRPCSQYILPNVYENILHVMNYNASLPLSSGTKYTTNKRKHDASGLIVYFVRSTVSLYMELCFFYRGRELCYFYRHREIRYSFPHHHQGPSCLSQEPPFVQRLDRHPNLPHIFLEACEELRFIIRG
jgi:hypothetical protein